MREKSTSQSRTRPPEAAVRHPGHHIASAVHAAVGSIVAWLSEGIGQEALRRQLRLPSIAARDANACCEQFAWHADGQRLQRLWVQHIQPDIVNGPPDGHAADATVLGAREGGDHDAGLGGAIAVVYHRLGRHLSRFGQGGRVQRLRAQCQVAQAGQLRRVLARVHDDLQQEHLMESQAGSA